MRNVLFASMHTYARRYVAAVVAIVIATGFIVAINALSAAARQGAEDAVGAQYVAADVIASEFDAAGLSTIRREADADPQVKATAVNWMAFAKVKYPSGSVPSSVGSIAFSADLRWQKASQGKLPDAPGEVAISAERARKFGLSIGDEVKIGEGKATTTYNVTGFVTDVPGSLEASVYVPEKAIAAISGAFPIELVLATDSGAASSVAGALAATSPHAHVETASSYLTARRLDATNGIDVFQKLIFVFAAISLFVCALVIANTFTILLAQRARDFALLRCMGAVRSQLIRSVVAEALVMALVASLLGVAAGFSLAIAGVALMHHFVPSTPLGAPSITAMGLVVPVALSTIVTVVASYLPARRAATSSPLAALQPQVAVRMRTKAGAVRLVSAFGFFAIGTAGMIYGLKGSLVIGMIGGMVSFVGVLLMTPILVPALISGLGPVAKRGGVPGRMALSNALSNPRRTASTSTALLIGVTLITAVVVGSSSINEKVNSRIDANRPVDLALTTHRSAIPAGVLQQVTDVDGVSKAVGLPGKTARLETASVGGMDLTVLGIDDKAVSLVHGNEWLRGLAPDVIVFPETEIALPDVGKNERVEVTIGDQQRTMKFIHVPGIGQTALVNRAAFRDLDNGAATRGIWVRASAGANAGDVTSAVKAIAENAGLDVDGGLPERAAVLKTLGVILSVTVGLLAVAVLIALIGVGNTLSLSILERLRENSLLRALGLERSGLRAMLAAEALLMAGVAAVLGVFLGSFYAWFGLRITSIKLFRTPPDLIMPWLQISLIVAVAVAAGLAASVVPARRAARIAPAAGLVAD